MNKTIVLIIGILFTAKLNSQAIPDFVATPGEIGIIDSTTILKISNKYDFIVALRHECSDNRAYPRKSIYFALAYKKNKWKFIKLILTFKLKRRIVHFEEEWSTKIQSSNFSKTTGDSLMSILNKNNLFSLFNDSINVYSKPTSDTTGFGMSISHGCYDHFIFAAGNKMRKIYAYEPQFYQDSIPVIQRAKFILCQTSFDSLTKKYWYRR